MRLSWDDLNALSRLADRKAAETSLPFKERKNWVRASERLFDGAPQRGDFRVTAELAELEAARQRDPRERQRLLDLARRAMEEWFA